MNIGGMLAMGSLVLLIVVLIAIHQENKALMRFLHSFEDENNHR